MNEESMQEERERPSLLPALKARAQEHYATGLTLLGSGVIDLATHNSNAVFFGLLATAVVSQVSPEIQDHVMRYLLHDQEQTEQRAQHMAQTLLAPEDEELDQSVSAKFKRIVSFGRWGATPAMSDQQVLVIDEEDEEDEELPQAEQRPRRSGQADPWIPERFTLDSVLDIVREFNERGYIYLGTSADGAIAIPLRDMYHVMDVSSSGKGKSNRFRLAMMQMVNRCTTYYINPFAASVKGVTDAREIEVWKPIYERLANQRPLKEGAEILSLLRTLIEEIARRNEQEEQMDFSWQKHPVFVFIDELPEIFARCPEAVKLLDRIGRGGRQFCIFCWVASQTASVEDIGQSTATQAQYKTRIYGGGDKNSCSRLMKGSIPANTERILQTSGAGLTLMLAEGMNASTFVRAPLVTNEGLFAYLELPAFNKADWIRTRVTPAPQQAQDRLEPVRAALPANAVPSREERTLPTLDLPTITTWFTSGRIDQATFAALVATLVPQNDATRGRAQGEGAPRQEHAITPRQALGTRHKAMEAKIQTACDAYLPGMTYRELAAALDVDASEARTLWSELKRRGLLHARVIEQGTEAAPGHIPHLQALPKPTPMEELKARPTDPADVAKAFALWQAGASSVRKLEEAAKLAGYGWSNGRCRDLIEEMEQLKLITKRKAGVM